jgi:succinate dehydrogenase / fumarate reductase cytochrome b subunit
VKKIHAKRDGDMRILTDSVGRKLLMAVTGFMMLFFVLVHMLGNSSIFINTQTPTGVSHAINAYAEKLHSLGAFVWVFRSFMLLMLGVHVWLGITLTLENSAANPSKYAVNKKLKATFSSETMIWTGILLLAFLIYHLAQFTLRVTPDIIEPARFNKPGDVYSMVVASFKFTPIAAIYVAAMVVLFLHVSHGIHSFLQTLGMCNDRTLPTFTAIAKLVAVIFLVGYSAIPVTILAGILTR